MTLYSLPHAFLPHLTTHFTVTLQISLNTRSLIPSIHVSLQTLPQSTSQSLLYIPSLPRPITPPLIPLASVVLQVSPSIVSPHHSRRVNSRNNNTTNSYLIAFDDSSWAGFALACHYWTCDVNPHRVPSLRPDLQADASFQIADGTLLHEAIRYNQPTQLRMLLRIAFERHSHHKPPAVTAVTRAGSGLLPDPSTPASLASWDAKGRTPLSLAVAIGARPCVAELLRGGFPLLCQDADGATPLHHAVDLVDLEAVSRVAPPLPTAHWIKRGAHVVLWSLSVVLFTRYSVQYLLLISVRRGECSPSFASPLPCSDSLPEVVRAPFFS